MKLSSGCVTITTTFLVCISSFTFIRFYDINCSINLIFLERQYIKHDSSCLFTKAIHLPKNNII